MWWMWICFWKGAGSKFSSFWKHTDEIDLKIIETELEVFVIVNFENGVLEARKVIIEKLGKQKEVVKVE